MIIRHKIIQENGEDVLLVYLDTNMVEFAEEFGETPKEREENLVNKVQNYLQDKKVNFSGKVVKVLVGALVVATFSLGLGQSMKAEAKAPTPHQVYIVESGDNLWNISKSVGISVDELKAINDLKTDKIFPGQTLLLRKDAEIGTVIVQKGDNLWTIANKYGMSVEELKELNNNVSDIIYPGQKLRVIQAKTQSYTVKSGDSLWKIANQYGMSVNELKSLNNLTSDNIYPGQILHVLEREKTTKTYTVQAGDNLWTLARNYNTTVEEIKRVNNLTSDIIRPNQVLIIPTTTTTATTPDTPTISTKYISVRRQSGVTQSIELEAYVTGVVAAELGAGFNEAAYKAQAVAARTYAARRIEEGKTISDTDSHQVYLDRNQIRSRWGENDFNKYYPLVEKAVKETKGEVLVYEGEYIDALFFSTSNGRTELPQYVWGGKLDYLQSVDSHWDKKSPYYYKVSTFTNGEFASRLGLSTTGLYAEVISRTANGSVNSINIGGRVFSGNYVKSRLGLRSTDFTIKFLSGKVSIEQRGWGHGVGLSQYGAYFMGEEGYNYQQILHHYYKGVDIVKI